MISAMAHVERVYTGAKRGGYALRLLLDRRLWLYLAGDAFFLFAGLLEAIDSMGGGDWLDRIYPRIVVMPMLVLGLPATAGVAALERRAGSLDLALAVPSTERYFLRRVAPIWLFMTFQGSIIMALAADGWDLARGVYQCAATAAVLAAAVMFWAVRLKTSGAVLVATLATVGLLSPWIFYSPAAVSALGVPPEFLGISLEVLSWCWKAAVESFAAAILFLYARERLRRPEVMLA